MKKIFKSPISWLFLGIIGTLVVVGLTAWLFFVKYGFKITYAPNLESSWDAVSACAGWAAVFVSGIGSTVSICFAIRVPKKIAEKQNRIDLFNKRYDLYVVFTKVTAFVKVVEEKGIKNKDEAVLEFIGFVGDNNIDNVDKDTALSKAKSLLFKIVAELGQIKYLFELKSDDLLDNFAKDLVGLIKAKDNKEFLLYLERIKKSANELHTKMDPFIEKHLYIK